MLSTIFMHDILNLTEPNFTCHQKTGMRLKMPSKTPLGYIELDNGSKEIYAMNDLFLNFTFEKQENWESFRLMINILLEAYPH